MNQKGNNPKPSWADVRLENVSELLEGRRFRIMNKEQYLQPWRKWKLVHDPRERKPGDDRNNPTPNESPNYRMNTFHVLEAA